MWKTFKQAFDIFLCLCRPPLFPGHLCNFEESISKPQSQGHQKKKKKMLIL